MKEAVTKIIDTLTQENFHVALQKLLERYNKCISTGGDYFEGDFSFICVLSIKVPIRKKSGNLFNDTRIYILRKNQIHWKTLPILTLMQNIFAVRIILIRPLFWNLRTWSVYVIGYCNPNILPACLILSKLKALQFSLLSIYIYIYIYRERERERCYMNFGGSEPDDKW